MNLLTKQKDSQTQKTNLWLPKRKGGICQKLGINIHTLKKITSEDLLYNKGNDTQHYVKTSKRRESDIYTCMCNITESLWCSPETKGYCKSTILQ